jgi:beta-galactosidase
LSNAATVTATLNGASLGTVSSSDRIFRWEGVTLEQGQNTVTVTATINGSAYTDSVLWTLG